MFLPEENRSLIVKIALQLVLTLVFLGRFKLYDFFNDSESVESRPLGKSNKFSFLEDELDSIVVAMPTFDGLILDFLLGKTLELTFAVFELEDIRFVVDILVSLGSPVTSLLVVRISVIDLVSSYKVIRTSAADDLSLCNLE